RTAVVLAERHQHAAALPLALAAVTLQPLQLAEIAVEVRPHLLDLVVERTALRRLSAEQREEAAARATQPLRLLAEPVEVGLLLARGILEALDLVGLGGVGAGAAVDQGELALEPQADRIAPARRRILRRRAGKAELRRCRRRA